MSIMKKLKLKLPAHWTNWKGRGEMGEIAFHLKATALGLAVSRPYGENLPFDFTVYTARTGSLRIQVRSSWSRWKWAYLINTHHSGLARGRDRGFDFLAVYIPHYDAWYIIPAEELRDRVAIYLYPHRKKRGLYEGFRNAWHLLTGDRGDDTRLIGLTIHAAAEK